MLLQCDQIESFTDKTFLQGITKLTCLGHYLGGPIIESKDMRAIFDKKGKKKARKSLKTAKKGKIFEIQARIYKIRKYFEKWQMIACDKTLNSQKKPCPSQRIFYFWHQFMYYLKKF